jgi:hypothetical protein
VRVFDRRIIRLLAATVMTPILGLVFAALLGNLGWSYWTRTGWDLLGFLLAGVAGARIARHHGTLVVALGMGLTWGVIAVVVLTHEVRSNGPIRSPIVVLVALALSVVAAAATQRYVNVGDLPETHREASTRMP